MTAPLSLGPESQSRNVTLSESCTLPVVATTALACLERVALDCLPSTSTASGAAAVGDCSSAGTSPSVAAVVGAAPSTASASPLASLHCIPGPSPSHSVGPHQFVRTSSVPFMPASCAGMPPMASTSMMVVNSSSSSAMGGGTYHPASGPPACPPGMMMSPAPPSVSCVGPPHGMMPPDFSSSRGSVLPSVSACGPSPVLPPPVPLFAGTGLLAAMESRLHEINKRLATLRLDVTDTMQWCEAFASEFFADDSLLTVVHHDPQDRIQGPRKFTIGRLLIPRFFKSLFESGVHDLQFVVKSAADITGMFPSLPPSSSAPSTSGSPAGVPPPGPPQHATLDCDRLTIHTAHVKQTPNRQLIHMSVITETRLVLDLSFEDMKIRRWYMQVLASQEFVDRNSLMECREIDLGIRNGLPMHTLTFLKLCAILEPMQELMSRHKAYSEVAPRDCLTYSVFQKFKRTQPVISQTPVSSMLPPDEAPPTRARKPRQKRKASAGGAGTKKSKANAAGTSPAPLGAVPPGPPQGNPFQINSQVDVMMVGEPSLMGGEFGEEDERVITRLENSQFDPVALQPGASGSMIPPAGLVHIKHEHDMGAFDPNSQSWPMGAPSNSFPGGPPNGVMYLTPPNGIPGNQPLRHPSNATPGAAPSEFHMGVISSSSSGSSCPVSTFLGQPPPTQSLTKIVNSLPNGSPSQALVPPVPSAGTPTTPTKGLSRASANSSPALQANGKSTPTSSSSGGTLADGPKQKAAAVARSTPPNFHTTGSVS